MKTNLYINIILIIGVVQGFFLSFLLFTFKRGNKKANRILGLLILLFTLMILPHTKTANDLQSGNARDAYIIHAMFFLLPPLIYLYVKTMTSGLKRSVLNNVVHFLPFIFLLIIYFPLRLIDMNNNIWHIINIILTVLIVAQLSVYLLSSITIVRYYQRNLKHSFSYLDKINLNWLKFLLWAQIIIWPLFIAAEFISLKPENMIWIVLAVFIYTMGYFGLRQPEIFIGALIENQGKTRNVRRQKYARSTLTSHMANIYYDRLLSFMNESKPHLKNDLSLPALADMLTVTQHHLSQIINEKTGQNFFDFINGYRIEEAKKNFANPEYAHWSIAAIGYEAGFNSVSSFNNVFKKMTGMTPTDYKNSL